MTLNIRYRRPLPKPGDKIRLDYGQDNPNTWAKWGEVRAVVDDDAIVALRWLPHLRRYHWELIERIKWSVLAYLHRPANRRYATIPMMRPDAPANAAVPWDSI